MNFSGFIRNVLLVVLLALALPAAYAERLRMATTTSTDNSGLLKVLNPVFEEQYDIKVDVIAVGTGQALKLGQNGDVDIVFAHDPGLEKEFVESGYGVERVPVMHNDFVIVGPANDPANISGADTAAAAFRRLTANRMPFISRGDSSGTHLKELAIWEAAGLKAGGRQYMAVGQGMGAVLQVAEQYQAYTLTDRGTYIAYEDKLDLIVLFEGDPILNNPYHIMAVNPEKHAHVKTEAANQYIEFIISKTGQDLIRNFEINGKRLFYPDVITD